MSEWKRVRLLKYGQHLGEFVYQDRGELAVLNKDELLQFLEKLALKTNLSVFITEGGERKWE